jgi:thiamine biosynthesis protein ThiI
MLLSHIRYVLKREGVAFQRIGRKRGRIYVTAQEPERAAEQVASKVFGVEYTAPALKTSTDFQTLVQDAVEFAESRLKGKRSFAVKARRAGEHPYTSRDLEVEIGAAILKRCGGTKKLKVNLKHPELTLHVEAREGDAYLYTEVHRGLGGLPFGSQGRVVAILNGSPTFTAAAWLMMKRGVHILPLVLAASSADWENLQEKTRPVEALRPYIPLPIFKAYVAPLQNLHRLLGENLKENLQEALVQRTTVRIACGLAAERGGMGVVLGLTLDSDPSDAVALLSLLTEVSDRPLFHPLIALERIEVEKICERLGLSFKPTRGGKGWADLDKGEVARVEKELNLPDVAEEILRAVKTVEM